MTANNLTIEDSPEIMKKISMATEQDPGSWGSYLNLNQIDRRNFLAMRVFSPKVKGEMNHYNVQKQSLEGKQLLMPSFYEMYLPGDVYKQAIETETPFEGKETTKLEVIKQATAKVEVAKPATATARVEVEKPTTKVEKTSKTKVAPKPTPVSLSEIEPIPGN